MTQKHFKKRPQSKKHTASESSDNKRSYYIFGKHAVRAALLNSKRQILSLASSKDTIDEEIAKLAEKRDIQVQTTDKASMADNLGDAVHQGVVAEVQDLHYPPLPVFAKTLQQKPHATVVVADRISDPQNIGAILRNVAAFNGDALLLPNHHAPKVGGVMAKAAAGALESVPVFYHTNLVQALDIFKKYGFWCYAADGNGEMELGACDFSSHCVFVLGSEGEGIRPLVMKNCDLNVRIPMESGIPESLNVASGSAVLLFQRYLKLQ